MMWKQVLGGRCFFKWLLLFLGLALGFWLLNVSRPGTEVVVCLEECATKTSLPEKNQLRILSLNMLHGFPDFTYLEQRVLLLSGEIGRLQPDIVLLQEVPWTKEQDQVALTLAQLGGFNYAYLRANGNRAFIGFEEGSAILSRYPLQNISFTELRPPATFFENRIVLHATAMTPQGGIDLFVTHLTNGKASINEAQAGSLLAFVEDEAMNPAIVAGDFNAVATSPQMLKLTDLWQDSYRLTHPDSPGGTCCASDLVNSLNSELQARVDYLFLVSTDEQLLRIVDSQRLFAEAFETADGRLWLSDHAGLLTIVTVEPQP